MRIVINSTIGFVMIILFSSIIMAVFIFSSCNLQFTDSEFFVAYAEAPSIMDETANAIGRYEEAQKRYPEKLEDLVDEGYLKEIPDIGAGFFCFEESPVNYLYKKLEDSNSQPFMIKATQMLNGVVTLLYYPIESENKKLLPLESKEWLKETKGLNVRRLNSRWVVID